MKMKILFISVHGDPLAKLGSSQAGGQNNYVKQLTSALSENGHQIDVATHWSNKRSKEFSYYGQNIRVIRIAAGKKGFVKKDLMRDLLGDFFHELEQKTDLASYDLIHSNYWLSGQVGLMIREKYSKPLVHTSHSLGYVKAGVTGIKDERRQKAEKQILETADRIIATTLDEKNKILKITSGNCDVSIVSIGVSQDFFNIVDRINPQPAKFMFTGRLNKAKGIFVLLEAFAEFLSAGHKDTSLVIAGGGAEDFDERGCCVPRSSEIRDALSEIRDNVIFIGSKSQPELAKLYSECTALIVPSHYESFGMVASEAQAAGLPVIASRVGGLKNVVLDGQTGLLFKNKKASDLVYCMKRLAEDRELNDRLGKNAARYAAETFNWHQISLMMGNVYDQLSGK
jgi:glycosyltransferase involved in cell wall biosynthesis